MQNLPVLPAVVNPVVSMEEEWYANRAGRIWDKRVNLGNRAANLLEYNRHGRRVDRLNMTRAFPHPLDKYGSNLRVPIHFLRDISEHQGRLKETVDGKECTYASILCIHVSGFQGIAFQPQQGCQTMT